MLRFLARFLAVILAVAFVLSAVAVIFFRPIGAGLARARFYKEALAGQGAYARFPVVFGETVRLTLDRQWRSPSGGPGPDQNQLESFRQLQAKDWETLLGAVMPADYLQREVEGVLDGMEAFLHSGADRPLATISLAEVKARLTGPAAVEAYTQVLSTKPLCTNQQYSASGGLPLACRPSPDRMPEALGNFNRIAQTLAEQMPDSLDPFRGELGAEAPLPAAGDLDEFRHRVRRIEEYARLSPVVPLILILLVGVFAVRGIRGLLLWWGVPCLIAGVIALMLALPTVFLARLSYATLIEPQLPTDVPVQTARAVFDLVAGLMSAFMAQPLQWAGGLALGGLVAVILSAFFRGSSRPAAVPAGNARPPA